MKVLQINSMPVGSTGKIMFDIGGCAVRNGIEMHYAYPTFDAPVPEEHKQDSYVIGNYMDSVISHILGRITGYNDCFSHHSTKAFIRYIEQLKPDILHLHNLHNCYLNLNMLFQYLKEKKLPVIWTLHDCWSFTGGCPYFTLEACEKWKEECHGCTQLKRYPKRYLDKSRQLFYKKKTLFNGMQDVILVTPSEWLSNLVKVSFLESYPCKVIRNGIDLKAFGVSTVDIRKQICAENKILILGCAYKWEKRKGLDSFIELANCIDDNYRIVLVGIDKKAEREIPHNIIAIPRITDRSKLCQFYTAADVFVNPTLEDNYPTTNLEAIACGTPVVTFNTGGSPETVNDQTGAVVAVGDVKEMYKKIQYIVANLRKYSTCCLQYAEEHDKAKMAAAYVKLYYEHIEK